VASMTLFILTIRFAEDTPVPKAIAEDLQSSRNHAVVVVLGI
jgi:hypothetical protein